VSDNKLTVLAGGTFVRGDLFSEDTLVIEGGVEGNIVGSRVIVKSRGWVHGDLTCRSLSIEPGGVVDGAVKVATKPSLPEAGETKAIAQGTNEASLPPGDEGAAQEAEPKDQ